jgi:transposase InsO family protein
MVPSISDLTVVIDRDPPFMTVSMANDERVPVTAIGSVTLPVTTADGTCTSIALSNVFVVPGIASRLFSCRWGYEHDGIETLLNSDRCLSLPNGIRVPFINHGIHYAIEPCIEAALVANAPDSVYIVPPPGFDASVTRIVLPKRICHDVVLAATAGVLPASADLWHARFGHFGVARVHRTLSESKIDALRGFDTSSCTACLSVKRRKGHPSKPSDQPELKYFGQRIDSDIAGPFPESPHGFTHAINFVDRFSRLYAVYFLRGTKHPNVLHAAELFIKDHAYLLVHTRQRGCVDEWHTDNGPEFTSTDMERWAAEMQHRQSFSVPEVHETNPSAERCWGVLLRVTRAMLAHAGGDAHQATFWPFLMLAAVQRHNNLYSYGNQPAAIPIVKAGDASAATPLRRFRVLLCDCYVQIKPMELFDKLSPRRIPAIHLGFDARRRGYFVYVPNLERITTVSDIDFIEHSFTALAAVRPGVKLLRRAHNTSLPEPIVPIALPAPAPAPPSRVLPPRAPPPPLPAVTSQMPTAAELAEGMRLLAQPSPSPVVAVASTAAADVVFLASSSVGESYAVEAAPGPIPIPRSFHEAVADPVYGDKWRAACDDDIRGKYTELKTWVLVKEIPPGRKAIKGKWVFVVKYKTDGSVEKFKARYVGCGYSQVPGVDFTDTFCSTLRLESFRAFVSGACINDEDMLEADVVKAFPSGDWDQTELYVLQPPGYENRAYAACRLLRPLEGTKQAGNLWMTGNAKTITSLGFERCLVEPNIWRKVINGSTTIRIAIYVDNLLLRFPKGQRAAVDTHFLEPYGKRYNITIVGEPTHLLGIQISRDRKARTMQLTQTLYIEKIYSKFCSDRTTKDFSIPVHASGIDTFHGMTPASDEELEAEQHALGSRSILELLGSLLWATSTRPDIAFYVSWLCQFMHKPRLAHYDAGLTILSYLHHTKSLGLCYSALRGEDLEVCCDASWGRHPRDFCGHAILFGGAAISFSSKRIRLVTQSSQEAEIYSYAYAAKDLRFLQQLLQFNGHAITLPTAISTDSSSAVPWIRNPGSTARTRHYDKFLMYGREQFLEKQSVPVWISSKDQCADIFTKCEEKSLFLRFRAKLLGHV